MVQVLFPNVALTRRVKGGHGTHPRTAVSSLYRTSPTSSVVFSVRGTKDSCLALPDPG